MYTVHLYTFSALRVRAHFSEFFTFDVAVELGLALIQAKPLVGILGIGSKGAVACLSRVYLAKLRAQRKFPHSTLW